MNLLAYFASLDPLRLLRNLPGGVAQGILWGVYEKDDTAAAMGMMTAGTECYIPLTTAKNFTHSKNYQSFAVVSKVGVDSDALAPKVESYLNGFYRSNRYFEVSAFSMSVMISAIGVSYLLQNTATYITGGQPMTYPAINVLNRTVNIVGTPTKIVVLVTPVLVLLLIGRKVLFSRRR